MMSFNNKVSQIPSATVWVSLLLLLGPLVNGFSPTTTCSSSTSRLFRLAAEGKRTSATIHEFHLSRSFYRHHQQEQLLNILLASPQEEQDTAQPQQLENQPNGTSDNDNNGADGSIRLALRRLAQLSLADYDWRMSVYKEKEADRKVEESLARMLGEDASYVRPMDASEKTIGPLGRAEKAAVEWISKVIDEEAARAKKIVNADGNLIRPIDAGDGELGPLGTLEMQWVEFLDSIRNSEAARVAKGIWRPKDLDESTRGPLGQLELAVVSALQDIQKAEMMRMEQSRLRGGEVVRPIDVPGPLGDFELAVADLIRTERMRAGTGQRPMNATVKGVLGELESQAVQAVRQLTEEERERLRNIQRRMKENRPMEIDKDSLLGILETILVGIIRAPLLLMGVFQRVSELMSSQSLDDKDKALLDKKPKDDSNLDKKSP